jgi:hypothetical protein
VPAIFARPTKSNNLITIADFPQSRRLQHSHG